MTKANAAAVLAAAVWALGGCGHGDERTTATTAPQQHRTATNPSTFPLYAPHEIIDVKTLDAGPMVAAFRRHDPHDRSGNYRGTEVVVATNAPIGELRAWLHKLKTAPPRGLRYNHTDTITSSDPAAMRSSGAEAATFESPDSARLVVVFAVDPRMLRSKLGSALDLVDQYNKVPGVLRGPIDASMKDQIGYSVTEMLDPTSPVGVAFHGLKTAEARNKRAIVLIDEKRASE